MKKYYNKADFILYSAGDAVYVSIIAGIIQKLINDRFKFKMLFSTQDFFYKNTPQNSINNFKNNFKMKSMDAIMFELNHIIYHYNMFIILDDAYESVWSSLLQTDTIQDDKIITPTVKPYAPIVNGGLSDKTLNTVANYYYYSYSYHYHYLTFPVYLVLMVLTYHHHFHYH